jgi:hypothetical protein
MSVSSTKRLAVPPDVLINVFDGEAVVLNLKSERYFGLDQVGTRMWHVLTELGSLGAACETLLAEYDVEPATLRHDLENLIEQLVEHGLVETHDG